MAKIGGRFFRKINDFSDKILELLTFGVVSKFINRKTKFCRNGGHNIFILFNILPRFSFPTSETERN